jgi:hypothetical protein
MSKLSYRLTDHPCRPAVARYLCNE